MTLTAEDVQTRREAYDDVQEDGITVSLRDPDDNWITSDSLGNPLKAIRGSLDMRHVDGETVLVTDSQLYFSTQQLEDVGAGGVSPNGWGVRYGLTGDRGPVRRVMPIPSGPEGVALTLVIARLG